MFSRTISLGLLKTAFKYHFKGCEFLISSCFLFPTNECQKSLFMRMFHAWYVWVSEGKAVLLMPSAWIVGTFRQH